MRLTTRGKLSVASELSTGNGGGGGEDCPRGERVRAELPAVLGKLSITCCCSLAAQ